MGKGIKLLWYRLAFIVNQKLKKRRRFTRWGKLTEFQFYKQLDPGAKKQKETEI